MERDADVTGRRRRRRRGVPRVRDIGPRDNGWKMRKGASQRQVDALSKAVNEGRSFDTDEELDAFLREHE